MHYNIILNNIKSLTWLISFFSSILNWEGGDILPEFNSDTRSNKHTSLACTCISFTGVLHITPPLYTPINRRISIPAVVGVIIAFSVLEFLAWKLGTPIEHKFTVSLQMYKGSPLTIMNSNVSSFDLQFQLTVSKEYNVLLSFHNIQFLKLGISYCLQNEQ